MKYITRAAAVILAAAMACTMAACNKEEEAPTAPAPTEPVTTVTPTQPSSTAGTEPTQAQPVQYNSSAVERTVEYEGLALMDINLRVPEITSMPGAGDYYATWLSDADYNAGLFEDMAREQYTDVTDVGGVFRTYTFESSFEVVRNDGVLLSVMREYVSDTGGVHPGVQLMAENFVAESGAMLTLDDFFAVGSDIYYPLIEENVLAAIDEHYGDDAENALYGDYKDLLMAKFDPKNFCVGADSVTFFWQAYDIGPFATDLPRFEISFDLLDGCIDPKWL